MVEVIAKSTEIEVQSNNQSTEGNKRIRMMYDGYVAVISQSPQGNHWLLTGWENKKETVEYANGEVRDSSNATAITPILTRRNGVNPTVSTTIIPNSAENVKK